LRVYVWKENVWNPTDNIMDYLSAVDWVSPKTSDHPGIGIYAIVLSLPKQNNPVRVCIILEGITDPTGSRTKVAAFIEVILNP